jgi:predicted deacylase
MPKEAVELAGNTIRPGEKGFGYLHVGTLSARTEVRVPYQVINGASDGPVLCLEATLQGWEPMGAEIIRRVTLKIDPKKLAGTIYCLPFSQPLGVDFGGSIESAGQRISPADHLDLNQVWPGAKTNAWLSQQQAYVLWNEVISRCEYIVDFHDGTGACNELPVAFPHPFPDNPPYLVGGAVEGVGEGDQPARVLDESYTQEMNAKIMELAKVFGASVIWWRQNPLNPRMLSAQCAINGIVPLVVEAGGGGIIDESIDQAVSCTMNVLKHLGMLEGDPVVPERQIMVENYLVYRSLMGGFYLKEPDADMGATVKKGQVLGRVVDPVTSEVVETCTSPVNGIVVSSRIRMPINPGGYIAHIADTDTITWER